MSLEKAIAELTSTVKTLISVLQTPPTETASEAPAAAPKADAATVAKLYAQQKGITDEPALTQEEANAAAAAVITEVAEKAAEVVAAPAVIAAEERPAATFEDITATVRRLIADGKRDIVIDALRQFNCTKASELKPEAYDDFLACVAEPV